MKLSGWFAAGPWLLAGLAVGARTGGAQGIDAACKGGTISELATQDACQKALDLFTFLAPQMGASLAGGNAVLGEHSVLRGPGHASLGLRLNGVRARIPRADIIRPVLTGAVPSTYFVEEQLIPVPTVDGAVGITRGFPMAGTNILGVDGLVNVAYVPKVNDSDVVVEPTAGQLKLGFGLRLGVIEETIVTPGISITWIQRDLPRVKVQARPAGDEVNVDRFEVQSTSWRAVVGKHFSILGFAIGAGQDTYEALGEARVRVTQGSISYAAGPIVGTEKLTYDNLFASASLALPAFRLVAEVGRTTGSRPATYNAFGSNPDGPIEFVSLGVRLRW
jgi:hypothetical protein